MTARARQFFFLALAILSVVMACGPRVSLPDYGPVPHFTMTDSSGRPFDSGSLAGKVWVVDFIYANCPAACPMMTSRMRKVAQQLQGASDVKILSISVDPARDTPAVLNNFAGHYGGASDQWRFLTGTPETVHLLAYETFHVGDVLGKIEHSTKFMLVDKQGKIRGYYSSTDDEGIPAMLKDLSTLRRAA